MKKIMIFLILMVIVAIPITIVFADDIDVFDRITEDLELESVLVKAGEGITERYDIETLGNKIPHQILATVESGSWIFNLPTTAIVYLEPDDKADNIIEYWDVAFANTKKGEIVFYRTIVNNDVIDRDSYAWNLKIKCKLIRYK
ncbi:hypothetical protein [Candidatus Kuenenia sp.]|uniref:hypothetical protein n=1 Tax=Candidatus Kuenenia sp. TaxID=2499824 RepID=UPI00321FA8F5